eukprot:scaffold45660_cov66-Phaeocystis_antarctica.AAC.3
MKAACTAASLRSCPSADGLRRAARVVPGRHGGHPRGGGARPQPHRSTGGRRRRRRAEWRGFELEHRHRGCGQAAVPPRQ